MPEKVNIIEWNQLEKRKYYLFLNVYTLGTNAVTLIRAVTSLLQPFFFWPISDRVNRVPL